MRGSRGRSCGLITSRRPLTSILSPEGARKPEPVGDQRWLWKIDFKLTHYHGFQIAAGFQCVYAGLGNRIDAMTNPAVAMRMLITYAICIPVAALVGYLLTNPLDYGTLGFLSFVLAVLLSPLLIRWHYSLLVFGLCCPAVCFFFPGKPPLWQVVVIVSLGIAIVERALNSEHRFVSVPVMTWPLMFIVLMGFITAELNGGINLHAVGGEVGGGRKYITLFVGAAAFFALTSRVIQPGHRKWFFYVWFLTGLLGIIGNLYPFLPSPLNQINLLFPPSMSLDKEITESTRFTAFSFAIGSITVFMLARHGLRGIFSAGQIWRLPVFMGSVLLSMLGGFRNVMAGLMINLALLFILEKLHRTRLALVVAMFVVILTTVVVTCSNSLPYTFQRSLCFLPLKWRTDVVLDAQASSEWRFKIWRATWPKVPQYLLLGKGYVLTKEDYDMIGQGQFANMTASHVDAAEESLAISGDYHSGPLSTLMPFGIWGAIGILWLQGATLFVLYRNWRYGDPGLQTMNLFFFVSTFTGAIAFYFIFGSFNDSVGDLAKVAGFSVAMNGGLGRPVSQPKVNPLIKPRPLPVPAAQSA
jgi:O-Antigen ligase